MTGKNPKKNLPPKSDYAEAVIDAGTKGPGEIRIASPALSAVIRRAVCSVDGVSRLAGSSLVDNIAEFVGSKKVMDRAIQITIGESSIEVVIAINIRYGFALPEIAANVKEARAVRAAFPRPDTAPGRSSGRACSGAPAPLRGAGSSPRRRSWC